MTVVGPWCNISIFHQPNSSFGGYETSCILHNEFQPPTKWKFHPTLRPQAAERAGRAGDCEGVSGEGRRGGGEAVARPREGAGVRARGAAPTQGQAQEDAGQTSTVQF